MWGAQHAPIGYQKTTPKATLDVLSIRLTRLRAPEAVAGEGRLSPLRQDEVRDAGTEHDFEERLGG